MQLVEKHIVKQNSPFYSEIDTAAFASKNLYNLATYHQRQRFFAGERVCSYVDLYNLLKAEDAFKAIPAKVAQQTLKLVDKCWKSYYAAVNEFRKTRNKFLNKPGVPAYKDKQGGRYPLVYTAQAISSRALRASIVKLSGLTIEVETKQTNINQVRIIPRKTHYVIEVVYTVEPKLANLDYSFVAGMDIGLDNLAVVSSNKPGFQPIVVNGKPLKSINQFYNKRKARLQHSLGSDKAQSHCIDRMSDKRNRRIDHYMHTASRRIVDRLVDERIGTLIIGQNADWKQQINIGKRNNQNFVLVPHARFVEMLKYKCQLVGIVTAITEESYTSKTSFLDGEEPVKHKRYAGHRIKRGLFKSANGTLINADLNGAYQIIKKVVPAAFCQGIEGVVVHPLPLGIN